MASGTSKRSRPALRIIGVVVLIVGLLGVGFALFVPMKPRYGGWVTFASNVAYAQALRAVMDLGLQTILPCGGGPDKLWVPVGESDTFTQEHRLWVGDTQLAPPYWPVRLRLTPGVTDVDTGEHSFSCPVFLVDNPPQEPIALSADRAGVYARLAFASGVSYDDALAFVSNQGLRLADPCTERSWTAGNLPWYSAGQAGTFAASHALTVATTRYAATTWRDQLQASPAQSMVSHVESPINIQC